MTLQAEVVLLTGYATSLLARGVLAKLLSAHPTARVLCPVTEAQFSAAEASLGELPPAERGRVEIRQGDVTAMDFGLSGQAFLKLAGEIDVIHHCGAVFYTGLERQTLETANIQAAGEVLELAKAAGRLKQLVFWSTATVSGSRQGLVLEDQFTRPRRFRSIAEETMFRAEKTIREAMKGLPVTILRPSLLVGDSKSGEIDYLDGPYLLIQFMLNSPPDLPIPLPGRGEIPLHVVPLDYVIDAGTAIASDARSIGRTFHIVDPAPLTVREIIELVAESVERPCEIADLPAGLAAALLRAPGVRRLAEIPRALLELTATAVEYDAHNARELMEGRGLQCPPLASYLNLMIKQTRRQSAALFSAPPRSSR